ncbi:MAG: hypothetical protein ACK4M7_04710, partial [Burkholderiales bacterium]
MYSLPSRFIHFFVAQRFLLPLLISNLLWWGFAALIPFSTTYSAIMSGIIQLIAFSLIYYVRPHPNKRQPIQWDIGHYLHLFLIFPAFIALSLAVPIDGFALCLQAIAYFFASFYCYHDWYKNSNAVHFTRQFHCISLWLIVIGVILAEIGSLFYFGGPSWPLAFAFLCYLLYMPVPLLNRLLIQPFPLLSWLWQNFTFKKRRSIARLFTNHFWLYPTIVIGIAATCLALLYLSHPFPILNFSFIIIYILTISVGVFLVRHRTRITYFTTLFGVLLLGSSTYFYDTTMLFSGLHRFPNLHSIVMLVALISLILMVRSPVIANYTTPYGKITLARNFAEDALVLIHNGTMHGAQYRHPNHYALPLAYYTPQGPAGQVLNTIPDIPLYQQVGIVGLGAGTIAAYGKPSQHYTFYEINPTIIDIAKQHFHYLALSKATYSIQIGDALTTLPT